MGNSSAATRRIDKQVRETPDYVDPARYRGKDGHKLKKKNKRKNRSPGNRQRRLAERAERSPVVFDPATASTYSEDEKFALMYLCVRSSVKAVSIQEQIPENTLWTWFKEVGGMLKVRQFVASKAEASFYNLIDATAQEINSRLEDAPDEELFETFRKMMDVADRAGIASPERRSGRRGEADGGPAHPQAGGITLNFGAAAQGQGEQPKDEEAVSVFDE